MRVGFGYDAHPFASGRRLILGGVDVPYERGLDGYSDADVASHAIIDALLGAAALGDCGTRFPAGDARFADAKSVELLRQAVSILVEAGFAVGNVDCTIVAEQPTLLTHIAAMRHGLATALGLDPGRVSVKAKRTEGLGFTGKGEGIEAFAVACIEEVR